MDHSGRSLGMRSSPLLCYVDLRHHPQELPLRVSLRGIYDSVSAHELHHDLHYKRALRRQHGSEESEQDMDEDVHHDVTPTEPESDEDDNIGT